MTECMETTAPYAAWRRGAMIAAPIVLVVFSLLHGAMSWCCAASRITTSGCGMCPRFRAAG